MKKKCILKRTANKPEFVCDICNKVWKRKTNLQSHLFVHNTLTSRFTCSHCFKEFYRTDAYARHLARHETQRKFHYCDHCGRGFIDKRNLIVHLGIHDDVTKPIPPRYHCNVCAANYCEKRLLKFHIRKEHLNLHNEEPEHLKKPLNESWIENVKDSKNCVLITKVRLNKLTIEKCKVEREIKTEKGKRDDLKTYLSSVFAKNTHDEAVSCCIQYSKAICDYCDKEMLKKSILKHIRERHLKLRGFNCDVCKRGFSRHYQLTAHNCDKKRRRRKNVVS